MKRDSLLGRGEGEIKQDTNKTRIQPEFWRQLGKRSVSHSLRNDNSAYSDTRDEIAEKPNVVVSWEPLDDREKAAKVSFGARSCWSDGLEPAYNRWVFFDIRDCVLLCIRKRERRGSF